MRSCLVLWEAPNWNEMRWFEFQLLYVSPPHLLVLPLMSRNPADREEEEEQEQQQQRLQRPIQMARQAPSAPLSSISPWGSGGGTGALS